MTFVPSVRECTERAVALRHRAATAQQKLRALQTELDPESAEPWTEIADALCVIDDACALIDATIANLRGGMAAPSTPPGGSSSRPAAASQHARSASTTPAHLARPARPIASPTPPAPAAKTAPRTASPSHGDDWMDADAVLARIGYSRAWLYAAMHAKRFPRPARRFGLKVLWRTSDVEAAIANTAATPKDGRALPRPAHRRRT